ncbi:MAG: family 43 glycosylhydrolase [Clostridia bacterium]|nr:family 43 glycosylhydrolase [Clostridia bacterium]
MNSKQLVNPYLPSWEYIPDGEPYVFDGRVYVFGSHDRFNGWVYCQNDYVCWSAPVDDLGSWRYEGVIYRKEQDPRNADGHMCLYAPDVTKGPDGRYYLYYVLDKVSVVSVAVCDTPAGQYEFYGYVHDENGGLLGERPGDEPQFDPGVLTEGDLTYMYTGFCWGHDASRHGPMATVLGPDMLTIVREPVFIAPSGPYSKGSGYEGHEFFEASSIRKKDGKYYFIYSSVLFCELCYAVSDHPTEGFAYGGVIVSNNDTGIAAYKPAHKPMYYGGNNHGSMVQIDGKWYIFYHRHTNGTNFSRQGCVERIHFREDGSIIQAEMTSCAGRETPLHGEGEYPAYIACHLLARDEEAYVDGTSGWMDCRFPKITQEGGDGDENPGYVCNLRDGAMAGFRYFDLKGVKAVSVKTRCYADGFVAVKTAWDGEALCRIPVHYANVWTTGTAQCALPDGVHALYFAFEGEGSLSLGSFTLHV